MDLLIGDVEQTGRGPGSVVIGAFLRCWHSERGGVIRRFLIDPDAGNG